MVTQIRQEGFHNSQVMQSASSIIDGIGERLTGSPNVKKANEWTRDQFTRWGLQNSHLEAYHFGRGWQNEFTSVRMVSPDFMELIAYPRARPCAYWPRVPLILRNIKVNSPERSSFSATCLK